MRSIAYIYKWEFLIGIIKRGNLIHRISFTFSDEKKLLKILGCNSYEYSEDEIFETIIKIYMKSLDLNNILNELYLDEIYLRNWNFWLEVYKIPFGKVVTYGDLASKLNMNPRVVGGLLKRNKFELIFPCHRVVSKKSLGGFRGNDLEDKVRIINFERNILKKL